MNKREICERLLKIHNALEDIEPPIGDVFHEVEELLLDLAAPDDHFADAGKMMREEEKHPGVIAKPGKDGEIEFCWCQKCYAKADVVHDPFGDGENWSYCKTCGVSFRLKRKEVEK